MRLSLDAGILSVSGERSQEVFSGTSMPFTDKVRR